MAKKERGRPSDYDPVFIEKVSLYLKDHQDKDKRVVKQSSEKYKMYDNKLVVKLPTIEGFARYIGVNKTTLYEWEEKHEDFSNALDEIRIEQKERLINMGLSGDYQAVIAKLILSSNHGMSDKQDIDHTSGGKTIKGVGVILDKAYGTDTDEED